MPKIWSLGTGGSAYRIVGTIDTPEYTGPFTVAMVSGNFSSVDVLDGVEPKDPPSATPEAAEALLAFGSRYRTGGRAILMFGNYPLTTTIRSIK